MYSVSRKRKLSDLWPDTADSVTSVFTAGLPPGAPDTFFSDRLKKVTSQFHQCTVVKTVHLSESERTHHSSAAHKCKECARLEESWMKAEKKARFTEQRLNATEVDRDWYKLHSAVLAPLREAVKFELLEVDSVSKVDRFHKCTSKVAALRRKSIQKGRGIRFETRAQMSLFKSGMLLYLRRNKLFCSKPEIDCGNGVFLPCAEALESQTITEHRVAALVGESKLVAKVPLEKGTVLGQYLGVEFTEEEFESVFKLSVAGPKHDLYAFNVHVDDTTVVIDALESMETGGGLYNPLLLSINDCRLDISTALPTAADSRLLNVDFLKVDFENWPSVFVATSRRVQRGEELMAFYGELYYNSLRASAAAQRAAECYSNRLARGSQDEDCQPQHTFRLE